MARRWADMSPEEKSQRRQARLDWTRREVDRQLATLHDGEQWKRWLDVAVAHPGQPLDNTLLILAQKPGATYLASYREWQQAGRQVRRGETGVRLLAPQTARRSHEQPEPTVADPTGARVTSLFDITQTDSPAPAPAATSGLGPRELWDSLTALAAQDGYHIQQTPARQSYTDFAAGAIHIPPGRPDPVQALAHELAHTRLHRPDQFTGPTTAGCQGQARVEAESAAYLLAHRHGLPASYDPVGHTPGWAAEIDDDPDQGAARTGRRVLDHTQRVTSQLHNPRPTPAAEQQQTRSAALGARADAGQRRTVSDRSRAHTHAPAAQPPGQAAGAERGPDRRRLVAAHAAAVEFYRHQLLDSDGGRGPRDYLTARGLGHVLARDSLWQVGYAPPMWRDLYDHLRRKDFSDEELEAAGLTTRSRNGAHIDRFRDRIMLPIRNQQGETVGFAGRASPDASGDTPKYLNTPATAIYDKSQILYGLAEQRGNLAAEARPVLVEGYFDALAVAAPGDQPPEVVGVATGGTALTAAHTQALAEATSQGTGAVTALDNDQAGREATLRAYDLLAGHGGPLHAAGLPAGTDPADMADHPAALRTLLSDPQYLTPLADVVIDDRLSRWEHLPTSPETNLAALRSAAPVLADLDPHQITQRVPALADRLDLSTETVTTEITEALTSGPTATARVADRDRRPDLHEQQASPAATVAAAFPTPVVGHSPSPGNSAESEPSHTPKPPAPTHERAAQPRP